MLEVLRARGFRRLLLGQSVSSLGDWVATLAFIAAAFALTGGDQAAVAVVLVLRLVPPILAAPIGGVVADRLSRRAVMVTADLLRAALIVLVPFVGIVGLYVIAFVHECISLFFLPSRDASIPVLVPERKLEEANGLMLAASYGSVPVAAAVFGGLRLAEGHLPLTSWLQGRPNAFAFLFDAVTFLFSAAMNAGLRLGGRAASGDAQLLRDLLEGVRYILRHPALRSLSYGLVVSMFGGGVLFAVGIGYVRETLGGSDTAFGWLAALWGAGMALGLGAVRLLSDRSRARQFLAAVALCGGVLALMALIPLLWLAFAAAVVFGMAFSVAIVLALTMAQEQAENGVRGRIMGGVQMLFRVGLGVGALAIGGLAHAVHRLSVPFTVDGNQVGLLAGAVLILLGALASAGVLTQVPEAPRRPEPRPVEHSAAATAHAGPSR
ncbi:MAG TPA: MFS transporter [Actinomycetota bacterium]|jgi:dTMP kinase|nr:MFS transporter [Actinomycetota bacterium]